jgi:hypothetical protein
MLFQKAESLLKPIRSSQSEDPALLNRQVIEKLLERQSETEIIPPLPKFSPMPPITASPQPKVN